MYPFNFKVENNFIDFRKIFVVMPLAEKYNTVYTDLIVPAIDNVNKKFDEKNKLHYTRADDPKNTRSGWLEILENIFSSRIIIGVLTGNNANVFYELGIAHATQQIERQLLLAEEEYQPKFDLKDLIYVKYNPTKISESIPSLTESIIDTLKIYDMKKDRQISLALSKIGMYEFEIIKEFGKVSHFVLEKNIEQKYFIGLSFLCHTGLTRLSTKSINGGINLEYSFYWTNLGNAVLNRMQIINTEEMYKRFNEYHKFFDV